MNNGNSLSVSLKTALYVVIFALIVTPEFAGASEGVPHGEHWELRRDGALIANFLVLLAGLLWLVFRFLLPALKNRTEELTNVMQQSETAKKEAGARLAELESKMREFEAQAVKIRNDAAEQGEKIKAKIIEDARASAARILEKAKAEIDNEGVKAQERLRRDAVALATELAEGLLKKNFNDGDQRNAVKGYIKSVEMMGGSK
ncbi:MAG: F0F1 ATP synthase subunit B [Nitrospinae bacterium]|nr:F0F1 ATP synthase subunit B [Nitrospinota bacterium]